MRRNFVAHPRTSDSPARSSIVVASAGPNHLAAAGAEPSRWRRGPLPRTCTREVQQNSDSDRDHHHHHHHPSRTARPHRTISPSLCRYPPEISETKTGPPVYQYPCQPNQTIPPCGRGHRRRFRRMRSIVVWPPAIGISETLPFARGASSGVSRRPSQRSCCIRAVVLPLPACRPPVP